MLSPALDELVNALRCLPGVGQKTAQRMALHLLERDRASARRLSQALADAVDKIGHCQQCRVFTEEELCQICRNPSRDQSQLCIVETPADLMAIEQGTQFRGRYFVLMGRLSPLDGIGPAELGMDELETRLHADDLQEVILATNATVEGETTAQYIAELAQQLDIKVTRIASGVPMGGELEHIDGGTLARALGARQVL